MRHLFRSIRSLNIYLVPASLLATAGILLLALLYYPTSTVVSTVRPVSPATAEARWHAQTDAMFAAMLFDALRQSQIERQTQGQTLMYHFAWLE